MKERIWIDADKGEITWACGPDSDLPVFHFGGLWDKIEPVWGSL